MNLSFPGVPAQTPGSFLFWRQKWKKTQEGKMGLFEPANGSILLTKPEKRSTNKKQFVCEGRQISSEINS